MNISWWLELTRFDSILDMGCEGRKQIKDTS